MRRFVPKVDNEWDSGVAPLPPSGCVTAGNSLNPTKITFVYSNRRPGRAFEAAYPAQLALARKLRCLTRLEA